MTLSFFSSEESRKETWLILAASLALCIEVTVLLYQLRLIHLPGLKASRVSEERRIGAVVFREKTLTSRAPRSLSWYPLTGGDAIHASDTVMTGSGARARIDLEGSGEIFLEGDTLIHFSDERKWTGNSSVVNLEVNQGTIRVKSQAAPVRLAVRNRRISIGPESEIIVEKGAAQVDSQIQVSKGKAVVSDTEKPDETGVTVNEGDRVSLPAAAVAMAHPVPVVVRLGQRFPPPGVRLFARGDKEEIRLKWDGEAGDVVEWDLQNSFSDPETEKAGGEATLKLKPGRYFWRVKRGSRLSEPADFIVVPQARYDLRYPASQAVLRRRDPVRLEWEKITDADSYHVEVSQDSGFSEIAFEQKLGDNAIVVPGLPSGQLFWRVRASSSQWGEWPVSETRSFSIKHKLAAPKPKGAKVLPGKPPEPKKGGWRMPLRDRLLAWARTALDWVIPDARADEEIYVWEFTWEPIKGAVGYRLEVTADPKFKRGIVRREVSETFVSLELPPGEKYYWRVAALDEDQELGRFSGVQSVLAPRRKIVRAPPVRAPAAQPPPKPPRSNGMGWLVPSWVRFGLGGGFVSQSVSSGSEQIRTSGFPLGNFGLSVHRSFGRSELELGLQYQRLRYSTKDAGIAPFQPDILAPQYGAHLLYKGLAHWGATPLTFGLGAKTFSDLRRTGSETAASRTLGYGALLAGLSPWQGSDRSAFWQADLLLEVAPLGPARGAGLWLRGRWGLWSIARPLTAEIEVLLHPTYRTVSAGGRTQINLETSVALVVGGLFDVSPTWVD